MAKRLELLYWDAVLTTWANANYRYWKTALDPDDWASIASDQGTDINPITAVHLSDAIGSSRRAKVTLINRPRQMGSSTENESKGRFTGTFTDFQNVRLRDAENGTILIAGKIYDIDEKFDFRYGTSIVLDIRDSIEELKISRTAGWPDKSFDSSTTRSAMINEFIAGEVLYVNSFLIATNGQNKVTTSLRSQDSDGQLEFKGNKIALVEIAQLAAEEPHSDENEEAHQIAQLAEALDTTETGVDVDTLLLGHGDAAAALAAGDYIQIDSEIMEVSSVSSNTITVVREKRGTTAATHADNQPVHKNPGAAKFGFDFHVDPAVVTNSVTAVAPAQHWNYYQRGTRPDSPKTYGMTIKYPAASSFTADGFTKLMQNDFSFNTASNELFTDVILEYTERGNQIDGAGDVAKGVAGGASVPKRRKFERLNITSANGRLAVEGLVKIGKIRTATNATTPTIPIDDFSTGDAFAGATTSDQVVNNGDYIQVGNEIMLVAGRTTSGDADAQTITVTDTGGSRDHQYGTSGASHSDGDVIYRNPFGQPDNWGGKPFGQTEIMNSATGGFGRIEYQSHIAGSGLESLDDPGFIVVSPFSNSDETEALTFNAHMPETYQTLTGSTTSNTVITNSGTTTRLAKTFGFKKTKIIKNSTSSDPALLRKQVVSVLSRDARTGTQRGEFKVSGYPYTYITAAAADITSRVNGTITFQSDAFDDNNGGTTGDARLYGVLVGDVICEMNATSTTITRYAYVSSVTATTVVYGGNTAADTSDGTALNVSNPIRIYVPLRAGHVVRVVNPLVQVDKDHLVTELVYDEGNGATFASISSIGQNDSSALFRPNILKQVNEQAVQFGPIPPDNANANNFNEG